MAMVVCWCEHVRECVCAHVCACVHACMHACVRSDVFAIYDNNTLPRLIMIIIKIIFLYFIEIAHTDDLPSTGTRLVQINSSVCHVVLTMVLGVYRVSKSARPN